MPPVPPEQQHNAPPPRGPHDQDTRSYGRTKQQPAAQRDNSPAEIANPHQRQGDRGSGDDDSAAGRAAKRAAKLDACRSRLAQCGFPIYIRYDDLEAAGVVRSWQQLFRIIDSEGFPEGVLLSPNIRAWQLSSVERWLESRPTARKVLPEGATPHKRRAVAEEEAT